MLDHTYNSPCKCAPQLPLPGTADGTWLLCVPFDRVTRAQTTIVVQVLLVGVGLIGLALYPLFLRVARRTAALRVVTRTRAESAESWHINPSTAAAAAATRAQAGLRHRANSSSSNSNPTSTSNTSSNPAATSASSQVGQQPGNEASKPPQLQQREMVYFYIIFLGGIALMVPYMGMLLHHEPFSW